MNETSDSTRSPAETGDEPSPLRAVLDLLRGRRNRGGEVNVRDALEEIIEERAESPIDSHERLLITKILHLRDVSAEDAMVPRADITAVEAGTDLETLVATLMRSGHSRLPVYRESLDDAVGMVHIKDVLAASTSGQPFRLIRLVRRVLFVSPTMRVLDLLLEMRLKQVHMALVVDEFGGIDGLVTIEDLVEQIVGEIEDEHDTGAEPELTPLTEGVYEADARVPVETLENHTGPILSDDEREEVDTLGGLVFAEAGRVPGRGELVTHPSGLEFQVVDADPRRIKRLRVRRMPEEAEGEGGNG